MNKEHDEYGEIIHSFLDDLESYGNETKNQMLKYEQIVQKFGLEISKHADKYNYQEQDEIVADIANSHEHTADHGAGLRQKTVRDPQSLHPHSRDEDRVGQERLEKIYDDVERLANSRHDAHGSTHLHVQDLQNEHARQGSKHPASRRTAYI
jgi:hypothetical protein